MENSVVSGIAFQKDQVKFTVDALDANIPLSPICPPASA